MDRAWISPHRLAWSSDWNGDEVGYDEVNVVGLYLIKDTDYGVYINMETMEILDILYFGEDEEHVQVPQIDIHGGRNL